MLANANIEDRAYIGPAKPISSNSPNSSEKNKPSTTPLSSSTTANNSSSTTAPNNSSGTTAAKQELELLSVKR